MKLRQRWLVRRLKQREPSAFRELIATYGSRIYSLNCRMLEDPHEAEDATQEVFVSVFKAVDRFRGESDLGTWIYRIAINHCKNRIRQRQRRAFHATQSLEQTRDNVIHASQGHSHGLFHSHVAQPDKAYEGRRLEAAIRQAIGELEEEQRIVLILRDIEGLSYEEISSVMDSPEGTVKSRLHRARWLIKAKLKQSLEEAP